MKPKEVQNMYQFQFVLLLSIYEKTEKYGTKVSVRDKVFTQGQAIQSFINRSVPRLWFNSYVVILEYFVITKGRFTSLA